jgi:hypothetical protein
MASDQEPQTESGTDTGGGPAVGRRSVLTVAGATVAAATGQAAGVSTDGTVAVSASFEPARTYGYGGSPALGDRTPSPAAVKTGGLLAVLAESEPNDKPGRATKIDLDRTVVGSVDSRDTDWFAFRPPKETAATVRIRSSATGTLAVVVYGAKNDKTDHTYLNAGETARFVVPAGSRQWRYLEVASVDGATGDYRLAVTPGDATTETTESTDSTVSTTADLGSQGYGDGQYGGA